MPHDHPHAPVNGQTDRRWLLGAFALVVVFMIGEVTAGLLAHSLALIADAGHMLTDAAALLLAVVVSRIAERPARGRYTYGFARVDALSGQANGITLLLLAVWFTVEGIARLIHPSQVMGGVVAVVAAIGLVVNIVATYLTGRANRASLNVRGAFAHLLTDAWAFGATLVAGLVVVWTGWLRADAVATLVVAVLMVSTGYGLVRDAGRVFLEAAPEGIDPSELGGQLAAVDGVAQIHDLHLWMLGSQENAVSAHVLVHPPHDCHEVAETLRAMLAAEHGIHHVTLQVDHAGTTRHDADNCAPAHGQIHIASGRPGPA